MIERVGDIATPVRVIDPGTGSGRYIVAAGRRFRHASLIGVEQDPVAAIMARATLAAAGLADRAQIILGDYRQFTPPLIDGRTLYVGNPPYVRHHLLDGSWKQWLLSEAAKYGLQASQLAGLHVHFFLATALKASRGDFGAFITSAEWLDVNYGSLVRQLFLGPLGGRRIVVIEPTALPFPDAATTAAITYFEIGSQPKAVKLKRVARAEQVAEFNGGRTIRRERLENETRWSHLTRQAIEVPQGFLELGELCRVHRGQVTGANRVWIAGPHSRGLPESVLFPTITKARELFGAGPELVDGSTLRCVIDLPVDLDLLDATVRGIVEKFLKKARELGAHLGYVAQNRKAWWSVGLREPAPILATYMARRPPAFVRNRAGARHINIAHGLYPREPFTEKVLNNLADFLTRFTRLTQGRTYAGGLTKFEPREMERLLVPGPELLEQGAFQ
jgi:adenine-specific DNA-methyltransferase